MLGGDLAGNVLLISLSRSRPLNPKVRIRLASGATSTARTFDYSAGPCTMCFCEDVLQGRGQSHEVQILARYWFQSVQKEAMLHNFHFLQASQYRDCISSQTMARA